VATKDFIKEIEEQSGYKLLVMFYNTEEQLFRTQLAMDVLPALRTALLSLEMEKSNAPLGLVLQSSGGILDSPWPIVSGIRATLQHHKNEFCVLVNEKAHSAATLIALSADKLLMSLFGSLSPIDPQINLNPAPNVRMSAGIEDIMGYYDLIKDLFEQDYAARSQAFGLLAQRIPPEILGQVQRIQELIKLLSQKMMSSRNQPVDGQVVEKLTRALTKEFFSHNYAISQAECRELGLPVEPFDAPVQTSLDHLYEGYRNEMQIGRDLTIDIPASATEAKVVKKRAFIETVHVRFAFSSEVTVKRDKTAQISDLGWIKENQQ